MLHVHFRIQIERAELSLVEFENVEGPKSLGAFVLPQSFNGKMFILNHATCLSCLFNVLVLTLVIFGAKILPFITQLTGNMRMDVLGGVGSEGLKVSR